MDDSRRPAVKLEIIPIGNSFGVILPKETLARLEVTGGDAVYLTETGDRFRITPHDPEFEAQMDVVERIMKKRREALRELAK
jgi:putative addiction module antidote